MSKRFSNHSSSKVGKLPSQRQLRVGEVIRGALAQLIHESNFSGTVLGEVSVTVSQVKVSPDLKHATVFVVPLGGEAPEGFIEALNEQNTRLQHAVGRMAKLRYTPRLHFCLDDSFEQAAHIRSLLDGLES